LLLSVFPESIEFPDPRNGLLPFQIACLSRSPMAALGVDVGFELLRAHPTIASSCGGNIRHGNAVVNTSGNDTRVGGLAR
jgi:hypothetical protein